MIISYNEFCHLPVEDTQKFLTDVTFDDIKDLDGKLSKFGFVSLVDLPKEYASSNYLVIIDKPAPNKYYGFDTKGFDGTYIGSPVTNEKQFLKDIATYDWRCICVDYGNVGVMARKEKAMLEFVDAKNHPEYYNASNGGSPFMKGYVSIEVLEKIISKLEKGEYEKVSKLKEEVYAITSHQVREQANGSKWSNDKVKEIEYKLEDTKGKWLKDNSPGVLILVDYFDKGEHLRVGTYHGTKAAMSCKYVTNLDVIEIPKEDWDGIEETEIEDLGLWDNRKGDNLQDYTTKSAAISNCVDFCQKNNCDQNDPRVENKLLRWQFGPSEIKDIKASMRQKIVEKRIIPIGHARVHYSDQDLEDLAEANTDKTTHCFIMKTTNYSNKWNDWEIFIKQTQNKMAIKKPNWLVLWLHQTDAAYDDWEKIRKTKDEHGNPVIQPTRKTKVESTILTLAEALKFEITISFRNLDYTKLKEIKKNDKNAA